jgi:hypothetical protein
MNTVGELIAALQEFPEDAPILCAHQPSWPLQETIEAVRQPAMDCKYCGGQNGHFEGCEDKSEFATSSIVYVVLGGQPEQPYAPREVFEEQ